MQYLFGILSFLTSLFLILLILIQRGRGGGLAGALGGMGGQSAFGTKAGDLFTRITIGVAAFWILLSVASIAVLNKSHSVFGEGSSSAFSGAGSDASKKDDQAGAESLGGVDSKSTTAPADAKGSGSLTGAVPPATPPVGEPAKNAESAPPPAALPAAEAPPAGAEKNAAKTPEKK